MSWIAEIGRRVGMFVRRGRFVRELDEEMRLHREMRERELVGGGMGVDEARCAASRAFGNATALSERGRKAWGWGWLEEVSQDVRFSLRVFVKGRGFSITAILMLALGIG